MEETITLEELQNRWEKTLAATDELVIQYPQYYHQIKDLLTEIVTKTIDISDYEDIAENLGRLIRKLDDASNQSIFYYFYDRFFPCSINKLKLLRVECWDLLEQLKAFDYWRRETHQLTILK
jgi:hypothetical protein